MGIYVAESGLGIVSTRNRRYVRTPTAAEVQAEAARRERARAEFQTRPANDTEDARPQPGRRGGAGIAVPPRNAPAPQGPRIVVPPLFAAPMLGSRTAVADRAKLAYWRTQGTSFAQTLANYEMAVRQFDSTLAACLRLANTFRNHPPASIQNLNNFRNTLRAVLASSTLQVVIQRGPSTVVGAFNPLLAAIDSEIERELRSHARGAVRVVSSPRPALNVDWLSVENAVRTLSEAVRLVYNQVLAERLDALARGILAAR